MATFIEVSVEERGEKQTAYINAETIRYVLPERDEKAFIAFDAERVLNDLRRSDAMRAGNRLLGQSRACGGFLFQVESCRAGGQLAKLLGLLK